MLFFANKQAPLERIQIESDIKIHFNEMIS